MHRTKFYIFKMTSRMVADKFFKHVGATPRPVGMSDGFVRDKMPLIEQHFTNTCI